MGKKIYPSRAGDLGPQFCGGVDNMRRLLRICWISFLSLFTADLLVALADWSARVEWVKSVLTAHPNVAAFVRTPWVMFVLLLLGFGFLWADRKIKLPRISARLVNTKLVPRLRTVTLQQVFDEESKKPGWDQYESDWDWFLEVQMVNESETPTTIEDVEVRVGVVRKFLGIRLPSWVPWGKTFPCKQVEDFSEHCIHRSVLDIYDNADSKIPSLMKEIKGKPLTIGIGHRGWLRFELRKITQHNLCRSELEIWLVDALQELHYVRYKKGTEKKWDNSFSIVEIGH